jgi:hypothetical protein
MRAVLLKNVKKGEVFKLRPTEKATVWIRDDYYREDKVYQYYSAYDVNRWGFNKGTRIVYVGFEW